MSQRLSGFRRHVEGYQLGVVAVTTALLAAVLAVPRAVPPDTLPLPEVDRPMQRRERQLERERARMAAEHRLAYEIRAVGEAFRRSGALLAAGSGGALDEIVELRRRTRGVRTTHGDQGLLQLRALQTELFVVALRKWEASGESSRDLVELGADFVRKARQSGWIRGERALEANDDERRVLFRVRWAELTGLLRAHPFSPSLNDWRAYYRFLLRNPQKAGRPHDPDSAREQLKYVAALERRDPEYPSLLARGVLLYWAGEHAEAAAHFRLHIQRHPHGPWRLRAQNHLLAALAPPP